MSELVDDVVAKFAQASQQEIKDIDVVIEELTSAAQTFPELPAQMEMAAAIYMHDGQFPALLAMMLSRVIYKLAEERTKTGAVDNEVRDNVEESSA